VKNDAFVYFFSFIEQPGSPTIILSATDIQATSLTVKWIAPADDGGSPITAYRVVILKGSLEIKIVNISDPDTTRVSVGDLERNTDYNVKVFARNVVFEGAPAQKTITTKMKGKMSSWQLSVSPTNQKIILLPCYSLFGLLYRRE
jgi:hypothetical protein